MTEHITFLKDGKINQVRKNKMHRSVIELKFIINSKFLQFYRK